MEQFLETIFRLDAQGDMVGLHDFVAQSGYGIDAVFVAFQQLLLRRKLRSAHLLAMILDKSGHADAVIALALGAGRLAYGNPENFAHSHELNRLRMLVDAQSPAQQTEFLKRFLPPVMITLSNIALPKMDQGMLVQAIELLRAAVPPYRPIFDFNQPMPAFSLEEQRRQGWEKARVIENPLPPVDAPRLPRRVMLDWPQRALHGHPVRLAAAFRQYGWQVEIFDRFWTSDNAAENGRALADLCRQQDTEFLFFHGDLRIAAPDAVRHYREMVAHLRQELPSIKVGCWLDDIDRWIGEARFMRELSDFCDVMCSSLCHPVPVYDHPDYAKKILRGWTPNTAGNYLVPDRPLDPQRMLYDASVYSDYWLRLIWLTAAEHKGIRINRVLTAFSYDNPVYQRSPLEYYAGYMKRLGESTCAVNFALIDGHRLMHGRTFETLFSGSLLLQEAAPNVWGYFIPGEHYLEFTTLAELAALVRFITEHPEEAEEVRRRGNAFACERYNDDRLVAQLDKFLFFPD
ncbi:MAG: glycosyltransferase [Magnetococcus sp. DMHC-8]